MPKSIAQLESEELSTTFEDAVWDDECILAWFHARKGPKCDNSDITPADIDLLNRLKHFRSKQDDGPQNDDWLNTDGPYSYDEHQKDRS